MSISTAREFFEITVPGMLKTRADKIKSIGNVVYEFQITGPQGGVWSLDLREAPRLLHEPTGEADCTVVMKDDDFAKMVNGELKAQMAFLTGKLKVTGNMGLALKLSTLFG